MGENATDLYGLAAYQHIVATFASWSMTAPRVPAHVIPQLSGGFPFTTTAGVDLDAISAYLWDTSAFLDESSPDFFIAGGHDNGYSSIWGFIVRAGGMICAIQDTIGSVSWGEDEAPRQYDRAFIAYNTRLAHLADQGTRPLNTLVLYSGLGRSASVLSTDRRFQSTSVSSVYLQDLLGESRWNQVVDVVTTPGLEEALSRMSSGEFDGCPELRAAVAFVTECVAP